MSATDLDARLRADSEWLARELDVKESDVILTRADHVRVVPVDWLWNGWLARRKLTILAGVPSMGKTTLALGVAAPLTCCGMFPDGTYCRERSNIVIWSGEDSADDTLVPRLMAAGADLTRVHIVSDVRHGKGRRPFDPSRDLPGLIAVANRVGNVALLILDPVSMAVAGDSHKNSEVRRGLQPVLDFAERCNAAALGITHFTKGTGGRDPLDRVTGSLAFGAAPRLVWAAAKDLDEEGNEVGRLLVRVKSNLGPEGGGVRYSFTQTEIISGVTASAVVWGDAVQGAAQDLLREPDAISSGKGDPEAEGRASARHEAAEFLSALLKGGPKSVDGIKEEAAAAGISWRTVERAKALIGARSTKAGFATGWGWTLPPEDRQPKAANSAEGHHHNGNGRSSGTTAEKQGVLPEKAPKAANVMRGEGVGGLRDGSDAGEVAL